MSSRRVQGFALVVGLIVAACGAEGAPDFGAVDEDAGTSSAFRGRTAGLATTAIGEVAREEVRLPEAQSLMVADGLCDGQPDGTSCGPGLVCSAGVCQNGCFIAGRFYAPGDEEQPPPRLPGECPIRIGDCPPIKPGCNQDQIRTTTFTINGVTCTGCDYCLVPPCQRISCGSNPLDASCGAYRQDVTSEAEGSCAKCPTCVVANNPCKECAPATSTTDWTARANGSACDNGDICTSGNTCQAGACVGEACVPPEACLLANACDPGVGCTFQPKPANAPCRAASCVDGKAEAAAVCDGASGACPASALVDCAPFACASGACLTACANAADCAPGAFCDGDICKTKKDDGGTCTAGAQCNSARCVDGRCCESTCTGQCEACDVPGHEGTCWPVTGAPRNGRTACATDGSACGGSCDGQTRNACAYPTAPCRDPSCNGATNMATLATSCDGQGHCPALQTVSCGTYPCGGTSCAGDCAKDSDCAANAFCAGHVCTTKLEPGAACATDGQCKSDHCVDGVCCDRACDGQCEACAEVGQAGTCSVVSGAPRGGRAACAGTGACQGTCDRTNAAVCTYPTATTTCAPGSCAGGTATSASTCDGAGACSQGLAKGCEPYACDADGCKTACAAAADCAPGYRCEASACVLDQGSADAGADAGSSSGADDGGAEGGPANEPPGSGAVAADASADGVSAGTSPADPASGRPETSGCSSGGTRASSSSAASLVVAALALGLARRRRESTRTCARDALDPD